MASPADALAPPSATTAGIGRVRVDGSLHIARAAMFASGFAALGYQIVWTQQFALALGHEVAAVLAVVTAFFGGIAIGARALDARIAASRRPARWYAGCEAVAAAWSVALVLALGPSTSLLRHAIGERPGAAWQWSVAFGGTLLLLLPATVALGATLPAMERAVSNLARRGGEIGGLYAANTLGAVTGVLVAGLWAIPALGLACTSLLCAAAGLACAAIATTWRFPEPAVEPASARAPSSNAPWLLAATGALGIGFETLVVRVLSQVDENTIYTYAWTLAVYLVGTALGAAAYQYWTRTRPRPATSTLLSAQFVACALGCISLWEVDAIGGALSRWAGPGVTGAFFAEAGVAAATFLAPTLVMGAVFSQLCSRAIEAGTTLGRCIAVNTLGAAVAPIVFCVLLLPAIGAGAAMLLTCAGYLALVLTLEPRSRFAWAGLLVVGIVALMASPLRFVDVPEGGRLVSYSDGPTAAVSVVEDAYGVTSLRIDNRQQEGSSGTGYADGRQALLPLLLHPAPRRALFLGLGTGVTATSATFDTHVRVEAVELLPAVIEASARFRKPLESTVGSTRLELHTADARRFVRTGNDAYDVIVADNFHPARSGSAALYTVEHFRSVRARLAASGIFCQWLPLHQLDEPTLRSIVRSFLTVFPDGAGLIATNSLETPVLGLTASRDGTRIDPRAIQSRLDSAGWRKSPATFGFEDEMSVVGTFIAGPDALGRWSRQAPLNTDDRPVVAYLAPRATYESQPRPSDRLLALLQHLRVQPAEVVRSNDAQWNARLAAYWRARAEFIAAGRDITPTADVDEMLAQVREPLLRVLAISPDFRPAFDPLLQMAVALQGRDPAASCALLQHLAELQPGRHDVRDALDRSSTEATACMPARADRSMP